MNSDFANESKLVHALQRHTATDFTLVYQTYASTLYAVLLRLVKDPVLAQDLLQDTFLRIWSNSHQYDPVRGRLFTWFLTIARRTALDALKANQRRRTLDSLVNDWTEKTSTINVFDGRTEGSLLSGLAPKYRLIIDLVYLQEYTSQEVATHLNLPLGTVKTRLRSGLQQLRVQYRRDVYHYANQSAKDSAFLEPSLPEMGGDSPACSGTM